MRYVAKPIIVDAHIVADVVIVGACGNEPGSYLLHLNNGTSVKATLEMACRLPTSRPEVGDYWVVQEDGYAYLNPHDVFERKYELLH